MSEVVFEQKISQNMGQGELEAIAEKSATAILLKIKEREKSILAAKDAAAKAAGIKTAFWRIGNTDEKVNATANALLKTNAALAEMNDLIQESIKYTCTSIQFAQVMHKTMAHLMVSGFRDANGNIQQLAGESKEFVELILNEADDFVSKQLAFEEKHAEIQVRLDKKDKIDAEQTQRLEQLHNLLDKKSAVDESQEKAIQLLFDYSQQKNQLDKEQSETIQKILKQTQLGKLSLILSTVSLITSLSACLALYLR